MPIIFLTIMLLSTGETCPYVIYPWHTSSEIACSIPERLCPPEGFERRPLPSDSYGAWLRHLPLKPQEAPVRLYNGTLKPRQDVHVAVIDIDVGDKNLQQCADAVIRLRAEYLYAQGRIDDIRFKCTSGDDAPYTRWRRGERPEVNGANVKWVKKAQPDNSHASFRAYLDTVFTYAGTLSLARDMVKASDPQVGDVLIQGGSPGHAVIIVDCAVSKTDGEQVFLLAQSYMPAQDIHVLRNPDNPDLSPWYHLKPDKMIRTPEWTFEYDDLKRFSGN